MLTISTNGYISKPSSDEIKKISYIRRDVNIDEIVSHIKEGYVFSANFNEDYTTTITQSDRRYENFISTPMVMFDLDRGIDCSLNELIDRLEYKPTIAYTTFSHQQDGKGNRYRLLYLFQEPIEDKDMYKGIYQKIKESFDFKIEDDCGKNPCQAVFGSSYDSEVIVTNEPYSIEDFNIEEKYHSKSIKKEKRNIIESKWNFQDKEFEYDFYHLGYEDIIHKYKDKYPFFEETILTNTNENSPYIILPKNYNKIQRYWINEKILNENNKEVWRHVRAKKIKDGNGRRRKLFINGILRRQMLPEITFEHLLCCFVFEMWYYIDNKQDKIKKQDLVTIATNVMEADVSVYSFEKRDKRKYAVNEAYCQKHNISKVAARNISRRIINHEKIGEMYDASLTDKQNLEVFKQNGLNVSLSTIKRFRKGMGLSKYNK